MLFELLFGSDSAGFTGCQVKLTRFATCGTIVKIFEILGEYSGETSLKRNMEASEYEEKLSMDGILPLE